MILMRVVFQTLGLALAQIRANKVRSCLTALGIIIGVASVTSVVAALGGFKSNVLSEFETFGAKKMWVWGQVPRELRGKLSWDLVRIKPEEADAIASNAPSIERLTGLIDISGTVQHGQIVKTGVRVTGVQPAWHDIENRFALMGRQFNSVDEESRRLVCMINEKAIEEFQLDSDPVGDSLIVSGRRYLIIGVLETKSASQMFGQGETRSEVYIPLATAQKFNRFAFMYCMAQVKDPKLAEEAKAEVRFVLRKMRQLDPKASDTFGVEVLQKFIDQFNALATGITAVAGGVVAISLLVGGIGIMNIMLVSVSERTREIGLRKAVGAKPSIILTQFLVEAIVLCLVGGLIGLVVGQALVLAIKSAPNAGLSKAEIPPWAIFLSLGFSAVVGVIFGMIPAIKASRLDPIDALRHS